MMNHAISHVYTEHTLSVLHTPNTLTKFARYDLRIIALLKNFVEDKKKKVKKT